MNIAVLSDTRMPTRVSFGGHGLGRSLARLAEGLADRGHNVTLFGAPDSFAWGCSVIYATDEKDWSIMCRPNNYDVIIDGTHQFDYAYTYPHYPVVCKVADGEGNAPRNRVYGNKSIPYFFGFEDHGITISDGVDVDNIPFSNFVRGPDLCFASAMHDWKKPEIAVAIAKGAGLPIWLVGEPQRSFNYWRIAYKPSLSGKEFYSWLGKMSGMVYPMGSLATMEAAATGTPSITMLEHDIWVEEGVSGFHCLTVESAVEAVKHLNELDKIKMRQWVSDTRSVATMAYQWEVVLEHVANGGLW